MTPAPLKCYLMSYQSDSKSEFRTGRQKQVLFPSGRVYLTLWITLFKAQLTGLVD